MNVVFFGSSKFVIPILEVLSKNFDLKLVLTTESPASPARLDSAERAGGPKPNLVPPWRDYPVIKYCVKNKIPYLSVSNLSDPKINSQLSNVNCQIAVLANFGLIIPKQILNAFTKGIINIHPSLLPKYRGPTPVQSAILNGEKTTGVSIMKLDDKIDHGPILAQEKEEILPLDTAESLYKRLFEKGANLLLKVINKYLEGDLKLTPQNHKKATFTNRLTRQDGYVDVSNEVTAVTKKDMLERMIRAYFPWPGAWTNIRINDKLLRIKLLPENKIQVEGKKPMTYKDFLNGYPKIGKELLSKLGIN